MDLSIKLYTPPPLSALKSPALQGHFAFTVLIHICGYIQYQQIMGFLCRTWKWIERWHHHTCGLLWFFLHPTVPKHGKIVCENTWTTQSTLINLFTQSHHKKAHLHYLQPQITACDTKEGKPPKVNIKQSS